MNNLMTHVNNYLPLFFQIFRFGVVGLSAAALNFSVVVLLVSMFSLPPLVANIFGFMISFQLSYWGHRLWTFHDTAVSHRTAYSKLILVQMVNFSANETLFYIFLSLHFPYQVALLLVLTILPIFTFLSSKLWVFR